MKASVEWLTIGYEADFAVPLFDIVAKAPEILRRIFKGIRENFPFALDPANTHLSPSETPAEARLRIGMFGGNASVDLKAARLKIDFFNLKLRDTDTCKQCIGLISEALPQACAEAVVQTDAITVMLRLKGEGDAIQHLAKFNGNTAYVDPAQIGATEHFPVISADLGNLRNGWRSSANVTVDPENAGSLGVFCQTKYSHSRSSISDRIDHQYQLLDTLFERINLEVSE